ncbi:hypothetical protein JCM10213_009030 [Rhodosporidiobolus nylandii]
MAAAPSSSSYLATAGKIALATTGVLAAATVGYAAYFDYKRRNDPVFRKSIAKQRVKVQKVSKKKEEVGAGQVKAALRRAIQLVNAEKVPETPEGKEQFFMEQVALGEQLAARSPEFYVASAISFYKALKVYPAPQELLMIYQKTQPQPVFDLVMELISLEINDAAAEASARNNLREENPLLEELNAPVSKQAEKDEDEEEIVVGSSAATAAPAAVSPAPASVASDDASPSSGSSFVHVGSDAVEVKDEQKDEIKTDEEVASAVDSEVVEVVTGAEANEQAQAQAVEDPEEPTLAA